MGLYSMRLAAIAAIALLAACSSPRHGRGDGPDGSGGRHEEEWHPPVGMLLRYVDKDGKVTRAEMEAGLRKDFAAADTNHDGMLEPDEARAVNEARLSEDQSAASPLVDWNHDGVVDFDEFATTARSLFDELDTNGDGVLTPQELKPHGSQTKPKGDGDKVGPGGHRHGGRGGQGGGGQGPGGGDQDGD